MARPQPRPGQQARAFLVPIADSDLPSNEAPVPIGIQEVILGSDPDQTTWAFPDPAIEPVHARLRLEEGQTLIFDEGTVAGTWVNYRLVPQQGSRLRHGDLVHLGCKPFQYKSRDPKDMRKPVILSQERSS
jgi:predicted component of type VI protein secretion system